MPCGFSAFEALHAATLGGARALGFGDRIRISVEPARRPTWSASIFPRMETQPLHHGLAAGVRHAAWQVSDVWIAGRASCASACWSMNIDAILANARRWRQRIAALGR